MTQGALAHVLGVSDSHISNLECGKREPAAQLLPVLDQTLGTEEYLTRLWDELTGSSRPAWLDEISILLRDARTVLDYQKDVFPALLQTEGYARELITAGMPWATSDVVEASVANRMARSTAFAESVAPLLWVVLDATVITRRFVTEQSRHAQLAHVAALAKADRISIQVVKANYIGHPGLTGSFKVVSPVDGADVVYADSIHEGQIITEAQHVANYRLLFGRLQAVARGPAESIEVLQEELGHE